MKFHTRSQNSNAPGQNEKWEDSSQRNWWKQKVPNLKYWIQYVLIYGVVSQGFLVIIVTSYHDTSMAPTPPTPPEGATNSSIVFTAISTTYFDDAPFCHNSLALSHPTTQCSAILLPLCATLIDLQEASLRFTPKRPPWPQPNTFLNRSPTNNGTSTPNSPQPINALNLPIFTRRHDPLPNWPLATAPKTKSYPEN